MSIAMCFVFISEQTANCATYSINCLVFITEMESVYSAVGTGVLNRAVRVLCLEDNTIQDNHFVTSQYRPHSFLLTL